MFADFEEEQLCDACKTMVEREGDLRVLTSDDFCRRCAARLDAWATKLLQSYDDELDDLMED